MTENIEPLPLCCSTRDFQYIGAGYILYFSSLVYLIIILIFAFIMNCNSLFENYDHNACLTYDPMFPCKDDWIHKTSVANYGRQYDTRGMVSFYYSAHEFGFQTIAIRHARNLQEPVGQRAQGDRH